MKDADPRTLMGAFIRAHRERLPVPVTATGRRRTPGWRREELADATGVGVTWITWLEQGRDVSASPAALGRLADALQLNPAERSSLFDLAGRRDPNSPAQIQGELPPHVMALPGLLEVPSYLMDHLWTARSWNAAATRLFSGWLDGERDRNLLRYVFLSPAARVLIADWPERAQRLVAEFRADFSRRPKDIDFQELIDELSEKSSHFAKLWSDQAVLGREGGVRTFQLPGGQVVRYQQTTLLVASHTESKLVCLVPLP